MIRRALIVLSVVALIGIALVVARLRSPDSQRRRAEAAAAAAQLREAMLSRTLGRDSATGWKGPRGAVMDWAVGSGLVTLVALDDGTVSLYLNPGGGIIGAGTHETVARAAGDFRANANAVAPRLTPASTFPRPGRDSVTFYLLTDSATLSSGSMLVGDVTAPGSPFAAAFEAAQALVTAIRRSS